MQSFPGRFRFAPGGTWLLPAAAALLLIPLLFAAAYLLSSPATVSLAQVLEHELGAAGPDYPSYRCTVGAHRGSSVLHRENTLAALKAAQDDPRYEFIEFDVQYTSDRHIVLFHDRLLLRLFGRFASIGNAAYAELVELTGGELAQYGEAMDLLTKKINIEIKSQGDPEEDERLADEIIADLRVRGRTEDVMISSISGELVRYISTTYPKIRTGQIYWLTLSTYVHLEILTEGLYERFSQSQADYLMLHVANLRNVESLLKLKPRAKTIMLWDFDDRMYLVHRDLTDRLWGMTFIGAIGREILFRLNWFGRLQQRKP